MKSLLDVEHFGAIDADNDELLLVLRVYQSRKSKDLAAGSKFENIDLNNARTEYSSYLMNELDDEIHKHLPNYQDLVELLRTVGVWQFSPQEFEKQFGHAKAATTLSPVTEALEQLYDFSLLGFYRPGGKGYGGSEYVFKYKEPKTRFEPSSTRFRVHPGLIDVLGLKRFTVGESENAAET